MYLARSCCSWCQRPNKRPTAFFTKLEQTILKCEQKTLNDQSHVEKKKQGWWHHNSRFQGILQSCSNLLFIANEPTLNLELCLLLCYSGLLQSNLTPRCVVRPCSQVKAAKNMPIDLVHWADKVVCIAAMYLELFNLSFQISFCTIIGTLLLRVSLDFISLYLF